MITAVLTSCGRYDLLEITLKSFFETNSAPVKHFVVVEDGPDIPKDTRERFAGHRIEWISTGRRVGQIAAIDYAYSRVATPYVFHLEDDWLFYRSGFLEKSLLVLQSNPKCLQVQIRALDDLNGHPLDVDTYTNHGVEWRRLAVDYSDAAGDWHGFSFNPGLRRLSDYVSVNGYGIHARFNIETPWQSESALGKLYRRRDFFTAVLSDDHGSGYARHTGAGRHIGGEVIA